MNSSEIKTFRLICNGNEKLTAIAKALKKSNSWCSEILGELEKHGFIDKLNIKRNRIYQVSERDYARKLRNLLTSMPAIKFEDFLHETKLDILCFTIYSEKSTNLIADTLKQSRKNIQNHTTSLIKRMLIKKANRKIVFNKETWPGLYEFLASYRNYSDINGFTLWKFKEEILFESQQENDAQKTGFSAFYKYGVPVLTISNTFYIGKNKINKASIFIHALKKTSIDARELSLLLAFFIKNKLNEKKHELSLLAEKYDCPERLEELINIYENKAKQDENSQLPSISREALANIMNQYGVKKWLMK